MRPALAAFAALSLCAAAAAGPLNLLANPDLELPLDAMHETDDTVAWELIEPTPDGLGGFANAATFATFANRTPGGDRGLWYRPFQGNVGAITVDAHLQQAVPGAPGAAYDLSAWFLFETGYAGANPVFPTQTILALDFLDAAQMPIASVELDLDAFQDNDSTWRQYSVNGVAPAGTAFVRARASMLDGVDSSMNPQSAFVDDFILVPAPGPIVLLLSALFFTVRGIRTR